MKRHVPVLRRRTSFDIHVTRIVTYTVKARDPDDALDVYMNLDDPEKAESHSETTDMRAEPADEE